MTSATATRQLLNRLRYRQKTQWIAAGFVSALALSLLLGSLCVLAESLFWLAPPARSLLHTLFLVGVAAPLLLWLLAALILLLLRRFPSNESLARQIWRRDEEVADGLLNALQMEQRGPGDSSRALHELAIERADRTARDLKASSYVNRRSLALAGRGAAVMLPALLLVLVLFGGRAQEGFFRLRHPHQDFIRPGTVLMDMAMPESLRVVQGDSLELRLRARHAVPRNPRFLLDEGTGVLRTHSAERDSADSSLYTATVPDIQRSFRLWARGERYSSRDTVFVRVINRPRLAHVQVELVPPTYTGLDPVHLPEGAGDVSGLPGSHVELDLEASRVLKSASLLLHPQAQAAPDTMALEVRERAVRGSFTLHAPGEWWVELLADDGIASDEPIRWTMNTREDLRPRVEVRIPEEGALIPDQLVVPLGVIADDDFGISRMNLRFRVHSTMMGPDSVGEDAFSSMPLQFNTETPGRAVVQALWSLREYPLLPTDEVHYFVEAFDNDTWRGAKRGRSELRKLVFPSIEELYAETDRQEEEATEELHRAMERAEQTRQELQESLEELRSNPEEMSWDKAQELQENLQRQDQALEKLREVAQTLEQMQQRAQEHQLFSEELQQKYQRLQQLLEELATPEMRQSMEKLQEALEQMDGEEIRQALEQMELDQEKLLENMDRSLQILEQLNAERKMDELATRMEDLAQRQQELSDRMEGAESEDSEQLARQQESLAEETENLQQAMREAAEELRQQNPQFADSLHQLAEEMAQSDLAEEMAQSQQSLQRGEMQQAKPHAEKSAQQLQQHAQRMRGMQQQMQQQNKQDLSEEMDRVFHAVLLLSRRLEELRSESATLGVASPRYRDLAGDQQALIGAVESVQREIYALMSKSFFVGAQIASLVERAKESMQSAIQQYTDRRPRDVTDDQSRALSLLHQSLKSLNQSQQQMQQSGSSTGYQEMMQRLEQMAQAQQQLNEMSQGMPMPMPNPSGQPGGQQLARMAARQRAMAQQMQQMEQESSSMSQLLGSLDGLSEAMEEVAKDLEERNITERTRRLQQRIVQRLLDSQRSLQQRELSRERIGRSADQLPHSNPGALSAREEGELRQRLLRALEADYSPSWRGVIRDYFRALEREENREAGDGNRNETPSSP